MSTLRLKSVLSLCRALTKCAGALARCFTPQGDVPYTRKQRPRAPLLFRAAERRLKWQNGKWALVGPTAKQTSALLTSQRADLEAGPQEQGSKVTYVWSTHGRPGNRSFHASEQAPKPESGCMSPLGLSYWATL